MPRSWFARLLAALILSTIAFSYGGPVICVTLHSAPQADEHGAHHPGQHDSTGPRVVPGINQSACMAPAHCGTAFGSPLSRVTAVSMMPEHPTDLPEPGSAGADRVTGPLPPPPRA